MRIHPIVALGLAACLVSASAEEENRIRSSFREVDTLFANPGEKVNLRMKWSNVGVGALHRPFRLRLALLDAAGNPSASAVGESDPRTWLPGDFDLTESLPLPRDLKAGDCKLVLTLEEPGALKPHFKLAIDAPEKDGFYEVGKVTVGCN